MKRILSLLLSATMIFAVVACNNDDTPETQTSQAPAQTTQPAQTEGEDTEAPDPETTAPTDTEAESEEPTDSEATEAPVAERDLGGRTIRYASWWDLTPVAGESEETDKLIERYAQLEEDYNLTFEYVTIPWEDYQRNFITAAMGGDTIGDVTIVEFNWLYPNLAMNGFVADVNELESFDFEEEKWNQTIRNLTTFDGKTYGFEVGRHFPVGILFFNKSMFDREGIEYPYETVMNGDWTWDKALEIAQTLTQDTDGDGTIDQFGISGTTLIQHFTHSNGGLAVDFQNDPMNPEFGLGSDQALRGFQEMQDWAQTHRVVELNPEGSEWDYSRTQFINGKIGMFAGQWWMVDSMVESMQDEWGILVFPKGPDHDQYVSHSTATNTTVIPEAAENKDDLAFIHNLRTEPLEDADPEDWRLYFEDRTTDMESVDIIQMIQDEALTVLDATSSFNGLVELSYSYNAQIETGAETPQAAIGAIADQAQNLIDTAMKATPDDIVDILTPDETEAAE